MSEKTVTFSVEEVENILSLLYDMLLENGRAPVLDIKTMIKFIESKHKPEHNI